MAVHLKPATALEFRRPFQEPVKETLTVTNNDAEPIAFKVKTTAPKAYCVRPNSGRIEPGESVIIQVILQAMKEDPPLSTKCKDKFLVQSMSITPDMRDIPLSEMWSLADRNPAQHQVHQQRVKVVFTAVGGSRIDEVDDQHMDSTFMSVNDSRFDTVRQFPLTNGGGESHLLPISQPITSFPEPQLEETLDRGASPVPDFHAAHEMPVPNTGIEDVISRAPVPLPTTTSPQRAAPTSRIAGSTELNALQLKYAEAQEEIARLRALLASAPEPSGELRRRNITSSVGDETLEVADDGDSEREAAKLKLQQEEYFSPQVVAIIALLVFTLTYLFF